MPFDAAILKTIREKQPGHITQQKVADGTGISRGNYAKKEAGQVAVTIEDLEKLAGFYGISPAVFFLSDDEIETLCKSHAKRENELQTKIDEAFALVMKLHRQLEQKDIECDDLRAEIARRSK